MLIEIDGVGFANKGSEMMLRETVRRVRENMPGASVAVSSRSGPYVARAEMELYQIPRFPRYRIEWGQAFRLLPRQYRRSLGLVMKHETNAILDASGFRYSDQWSPRQVRKLAGRAERMRATNGTIVLLPQAFGPFSGQSERFVSTVVEKVDLIYARDEISYNHIVEAAGESPNVRIAPDFTPPLPGFLRAKHEALRDRFCLIPNRRMLDKTEAGVRDAYVPLMRHCLQLLCERGTNPFLLIHETRDVGLAREMVGSLPRSVEIVTEADARAIKGIIGVSAGVISSRYHGLVNALSQGVPALGTGWSHKYQMLFNDYAHDDGLIPVPTEVALLDHKLSLLIDESSRKRISAGLHAAAERQRLAIERMWTEVFTVLMGG